MTDSERPIIVTNHAIYAYRRRLQHFVPDHILEEEIRNCVAAALEAGNVHRKRPDGFLLYGDKPYKLPPGQRFVQCDPEANYGFIIKRNPDEGDVVMTTLIRVGVR